MNLPENLSVGLRLLAESHKIRRYQLRRPYTRPLVFLLAILSLAVLLSACDGDQPSTIRKKITAADGGTVSLEDDITLRISAGALSEDAIVTISTPTNENPVPSGLEGAASVGQAASIDLDGHELLKPVTLELAFDPGSLPGDTPEELIFPGYFDEDEQEWIPVSGQVDFERRVVTVETDRLSWWNSFVWDWEAWIAIIETTLSSNVSDLVEEVAGSSQSCTVWNRHVTSDNSRGNDVIEGCIIKGDASSPELSVVNLRSFSVSLSPQPGGPGYPEATTLGPEQTASFAADTSDKPPAVVYADLTEESLRWIVTDLALSLLPLGDTVSTEGRGFIADALKGRGTGSLLADLGQDPQKGAETFAILITTDDFIETFSAAATEFGQTEEEFEFMTKWGEVGIGKVLSAVADADVLSPITEFLADRFIDNRPSVTFFWIVP